MLHNPNPNTAKLDALAAQVVRVALAWERERGERLAGTGTAHIARSSAVESDQPLAEAVKVYRQALVDEAVLAERPAHPPDEPSNSSC